MLFYYYNYLECWKINRDTWKIESYWTNLYKLFTNIVFIVYTNMHNAHSRYTYTYYIHKYKEYRMNTLHQCIDVKYVYFKLEYEIPVIFNSFILA